MKVKINTEKWTFWYAWFIGILILWLILIVIVNVEGAPPGGIPPGQLKKMSDPPPGTLPPPGFIPPGQLKKIKGQPPPVPTPTPPLTGFGALIGGVTAQEKADWLSGRTQFQTAELVEDGLGPIFNGQSCFQCHSSPDIPGVVGPTIGGASAVTETRFGDTLTGVFDLLHQASTQASVQDEIPPGSNVVAHRLVTPLFGIGLMEAIPDSAILANSQKGIDGVFGRAAILTDATDVQVRSLTNGSANVVGRFGWKCQRASALAFAFDAQVNELGETNRGADMGSDIAPHVPNGFALLVAAEPPGITPTTLQDTPNDPTQPENPVTNKDDSDRYRDFMEFNAPPPQAPLTASAQSGQALFSSIGCARCHTPSYNTGPNVSAALSFQNVALFSDLRLHIMGSLADGIPQATATGLEMRTAPLWGLRARGPYLHDGRAQTVLEAIQAHDATGAESQIIAQRFMRLPSSKQQAILDFLNSI